MIDKTYCCNISCGINGTGTIKGDIYKFNEDKSFCELTSLYYISPIFIEGTRYCYISYDLLINIYNLFNFNMHYKYCSFKSREDLLINKFFLLNLGKFIYSLGEGHNHFDKRLMDTSRGKSLIEFPFLIYPTFGI